jgi:hypothetical protein
VLCAAARGAVLSNNQTVVWMGDSIYHPVQAAAYVESAFQFSGQICVIRGRRRVIGGTGRRMWAGRI